MVAEVFEKDCFDYMNSKNDKVVSLPLLDIFQLYDCYMEKKIYLHLKKRNLINFNDADGIELAEYFKVKQLKFHKLFGLKLLLQSHEKMFENFTTQSTREEMEKWKLDYISGKNNIGIINSFAETYPQFNHLTFAEYFAAWFFVDVMYDNSEKVFETINLIIQKLTPVFTKCFISFLQKNDNNRKLHSLLNGTSLVGYAIRSNHNHIVYALLGDYSNFPHADKSTRQPFHYAVDADNVVALVMILNKMYYLFETHNIFPLDFRILLFVDKINEQNPKIFISSRNKASDCETLLDELKLYRAPSSDPYGLYHMNYYKSCWWLNGIALNSSITKKNFACFEDLLRYFINYNIFEEIVEIRFGKENFFFDLFFNKKFDEEEYIEIFTIIQRCLCSKNNELFKKIVISATVMTIQRSFLKLFVTLLEYNKDNLYNLYTSEAMFYKQHEMVQHLKYKYSKKINFFILAVCFDAPLHIMDQFFSLEDIVNDIKVITENTELRQANKIRHMFARRIHKLKFVKLLFAKKFDFQSNYGTKIVKKVLNGNNKDTILFLISKCLEVMWKLSDCNDFWRDKLEIYKNGMNEFIQVKLNNFPRLHYLILRNRTEIVKFCIENGADIHVKDDNGKTLLHYASKTNNYKLSEMLLSHGAVYNDTDNDGKTAEALTTNKEIKDLFQRVDMWFSTSSFPEKKDAQTWKARNKCKQSLLHILILNNQKKKIRNLLWRYRSLLNAVDKDGNTPLHLAAKLGIQEIAYLLLNNGAMFNVENKNGDTPKSITIDVNIIDYIHGIENIFAAVKAQDVSKLKKLIKNKKYFFKLRDKNGKSLSHFALSCEVIKELIESGRNIPRFFTAAFLNAKDIYDKTPLFYAVKNNDFNLVKILFENCVPYNYDDFSTLPSNDCTIFLKHLSELFDELCTTNYVEIFEALKTYDISMENIANIRERNGNSFLYILHEEKRNKLLNFFGNLKCEKCRHNNFKKSEWMISFQRDLTDKYSQRELEEALFHSDVLF